MAYAITHHFPGGTKEQYEATLRAVLSSRERLPEGQIFHAPGPSDGGWTVVAVWDSGQGWEQFRDGVLMRKLGQGIEGGFATPPQEAVFDVHNLQR